MPLLMCPNDDAAMQTLERAGVQFDMCPKCRGVWLDRGELEKLMDSATAEGRATAPSQPAYAPTPPPQQPPQAWSQRPDSYRSDDKDRYRRDDDDFYRKRKKRDSIFDIFD